MFWSGGILVTLLQEVFWSSPRERNGHATGTNAIPLPKRPILSLNDGHSEEVYEEPFSVPLARQQSDTSRSSALIPAKNQQSLIPGHTAQSICDTTFQNHDRLSANVEAGGADVRQASRTANDATKAPLLPIPLSTHKALKSGVQYSKFAITPLTRIINGIDRLKQRVFCCLPSK